MSGEYGITSAPLDIATQFAYLEPRTSDPTDLRGPSLWLRTDIADTSADPPELATLRYYDGTTTHDIPILDTGTSTADVPEVFRMKTPNGTGYIPIIESGAAYPAVSLQHNNTIHGLHDSPGPSVRMFDNASYQWWAGAGIGVSDGQTASSWLDQMGDVTASATGSPTYRADQDGEPAVEFDGSQDGYDVSINSDNAKDPLSVAMLVYNRDASSTQRLYVQGGDSSYDNIFFEIDNGNLQVSADGADTFSVTGSAVGTGSWATIGFATSSNNTVVDIYLNGSNDGSDTGGTSASYNRDGLSYGYDRINSGSYADVYIAEVVICKGTESDQAFSDYHSNRLG
jgi:hypothetical protein